MTRPDDRMDHRSIKKFKQDIKKATKDQAVIIHSWLHTINKNDLQVTDNGIDNSGKYINTSQKVTNDPDYHVALFGLIEVQYAKPYCETFFHIKKEKLLTCRRLKAKILMVDGWRTDAPKYTLITENQMKIIVSRCKVVRWQGVGGKDAYQIPLCWFDWMELKKCTQ